MFASEHFTTLKNSKRKKKHQATERKGSQKSNYCVVENDITVEQIRTVVYIYFDLRCCWHVTVAAACLFFFIWLCFFSVLLNSFASFVYFGHNKLECGLVFCISKISQIEIFNSFFDMKFDWLKVYKRWKWTAIFGPTLNQITDVNWHN